MGSCASKPDKHPAGPGVAPPKAAVFETGPAILEAAAVCLPKNVTPDAASPDAAGSNASTPAFVSFSQRTSAKMPDPITTSEVRLSSLGPKRVSSPVTQPSTLVGLPPGVLLPGVDSASTMPSSSVSSSVPGDNDSIESVLKLISNVFNMQTSLVSLFQDRRVYIKEGQNPVRQGDFPWRHILCSFCSRTDTSLTIVEDTLDDIRFLGVEGVAASMTGPGDRTLLRSFIGAPLMSTDGKYHLGTGVATSMTGPGDGTLLRSFIGAPLMSTDGKYHLGTVCLGDSKPHVVDMAQTMLLSNLSKMIVRNVEKDIELLLKQQDTKALNAAYAQLKSTMDCIDSCMVLLDTTIPGFKMTSTNTAWKKVTGLDPTHAVGNTVANLLVTREGLPIPTKEHQDMARENRVFKLCRMAPSSESHGTNPEALMGSHYFMNISAYDPRITSGSARTNSVADNTAGIIEGLEVGRLLGKGAFGSVYSGLWFGTPVAVKVIDQDMRSIAASGGVNMEALMGAGLRHPHIACTLKYMIRYPAGVNSNTNLEHWDLTCCSQSTAVVDSLSSKQDDELKRHLYDEENAEDLERSSTPPVKRNRNPPKSVERPTGGTAETGGPTALASNSSGTAQGSDLTTAVPAAGKGSVHGASEVLDLDAVASEGDALYREGPGKTGDRGAEEGSVSPEAEGAEEGYVSPEAVDGSEKHSRWAVIDFALPEMEDSDEDSEEKNGFYRPMERGGGVESSLPPLPEEASFCKEVNFQRLSELSQGKAKTQAPSRALLKNVGVQEEDFDSRGSVSSAQGVFPVSKATPNTSEWKQSFASGMSERTMDSCKPELQAQTDAIEEGVFLDPATGVVNMLALLATAFELAGALHYLHTSANIIHGDLSAYNVLLAKSVSTEQTGSRGFHIKIADFGLARIMDIMHGSRIQTKTYGTITHMPPETLLDGIISKSVDVYSFGVLLWQMYKGQRPYASAPTPHLPHPTYRDYSSGRWNRPYAGLQHSQIIMAVISHKETKLQFPPGAPADLVALVHSCLAYESDDRPAMGAVMKDVKAMQKEALMYA
eukprot:gene13679-19567_t